MTAFHVFLAGLVVIVVVRLLQHSRRCSSSEELDTIRCLPSFGFAAATMLQHVATGTGNNSNYAPWPCMHTGWSSPCGSWYLIVLHFCVLNTRQPHGLLDMRLNNRTSMTGWGTEWIIACCGSFMHACEPCHDGTELRSFMLPSGIIRTIVEHYSKSGITCSGHWSKRFFAHRIMPTKCCTRWLCARSPDRARMFPSNGIHCPGVLSGRVPYTQWRVLTPVCENRAPAYQRKKSTLLQGFAPL